MQKYLSLLCFALAFYFNATAVWAFMPNYDDDAEFTACTKVSEWDACAADEAQRFLRTVKREYRTILSSPQILQWHAEPAVNTSILRDMFESWTAFRNRLCSLSSKAVEYVEPITDEKTACNLYYILHHHDHLNSVLLLMTKRAPKNRQDFEFLKIYDHDEEYEECIEKKQPNCIEEELKRSAQTIKDYYKTLSEDEMVGKWNNGPDLTQGNYRDMFDSWIAYRNRMCALAVWAYKSYYGPQSMNMTTCLQFYNREKLETLDNLLVVAHSTLDVGLSDDDSEGENNYDPFADDDGGAAEGRTITPLERRVSSGSSNPDDVLVKTEEKPQEQKIMQPQSQENTQNIPSWAQ